MGMYEEIDNLPSRRAKPTVENIKVEPKKQDVQDIRETITEMENNIQKTDDIIPKDVTVTDLDLQTVQTQTTLDKAFSELFSSIALEKKTEFLKNREIKNLGTLYSMAKHYGFTALQERIIKHMEMRVSLKRGGRKEAIQLVQAERQHEELKNMVDKYTRSNNP